jgi:hypothetical protein
VNALTNLGGCGQLGPAGPEPDGEFADIGEAMAALPNDKWRRFVRYYVTHEPKHGALKNAYLAAGFNDTRHANSGACKLAKDPRIIMAVREESHKQLRFGAPLAVNFVYELLLNPAVDERTRLKAAMALLDRTDPLQTLHAHKVDVTHKVVNHDDEMLANLAAMKKLDVPRAKLIDLFGANGLERLERMEALRASQTAKLIEGKAE